MFFCAPFSPWQSAWSEIGHPEPYASGTSTGAASDGDETSSGGIDASEIDVGSMRLRSLLLEANSAHFSDSEEGDAVVDEEAEKDNPSPVEVRQTSSRRRRSDRGRGGEDLGVKDDEKAAVAVAAVVEAVLLCPPGVLARNSSVGSSSSSLLSLRHSTGDGQDSSGVEEDEGAAAAVAAALAWNSFPTVRLSSVEEECGGSASESGGDGSGVEAAVRAALAWQPSSSSSARDMSPAAWMRNRADPRLEEGDDQPAYDHGDSDHPESDHCDEDCGGVGVGDLDTPGPSAAKISTVLKMSDGSRGGGSEAWRTDSKGDTLPPSPLVSGSADEWVEKDDVQGSGTYSGSSRRCSSGGSLDKHGSFKSVSGLAVDTKNESPLRGACGVETKAGGDDISAMMSKAAARIAALPQRDRDRLADLDRSSDGGGFSGGSDGESVADSDASSPAVFVPLVRPLVRVGWSKGGGATRGTPFRFQRLAGLGRNWPRGVDPARREEWLCSLEFEAVFSMPFAAYRELPAWKKVILKRKFCLF